MPGLNSPMDDRRRTTLCLHRQACPESSEGTPRTPRVAKVLIVFESQRTRRAQRAQRFLWVSRFALRASRHRRSSSLWYTDFAMATKTPTGAEMPPQDAADGDTRQIELVAKPGNAKDAALQGA